MTQTVVDQSTTGEEREARRRRRWWGSLAGLAIGGGCLLVALFIFARLNQLAPDHIVDALPAWAAISGLTIFLSLAGVTFWLQWRAIDEFELRDNLWSGSISFVTYVLLFVSWWWLNLNGIAPPRDDWAILIVSTAAGWVLFVARRWRNL